MAVVFCISISMKSVSVAYALLKVLSYFTFSSCKDGNSRDGNDGTWKWNCFFWVGSLAPSLEISRDTERLYCSPSGGFYPQDKWWKDVAESVDLCSTSPHHKAAPSPSLQLLATLTCVVYAARIEALRPSAEINSSIMSFGLSRPQSSLGSLAQTLSHSCTMQTSMTQTTNPEAWWL